MGPLVPHDWSRHGVSTLETKNAIISLRNGGSTCTDEHAAAYRQNAEEWIEWHRGTATALTTVELATIAPTYPALLFLIVTFCVFTCQISLAYLTAATHGLEEDAARLRELLEAQGMPIPEVRGAPRSLSPPLIVDLTLSDATDQTISLANTPFFLF